MASAFNEFSKRSYEEAKLSNIIREANIPRGSFYQYFKDKKDLYLYVFELVKIKKLEYLGELLPNKQEIPFLKLFKLLYKQAVVFSFNHPEFTNIYKLFLSSKGDIYYEVMGEGLALTRSYYISYIDSDKSKGIIRKDIDSEILADLVIQLTTNIGLDEFKKDNIDYGSLSNKIDSLVNIIQKGIV